MVEMRGIEPLSKRSPTFRHLQFSPMVDKTVTCPSDIPSLNVPVICRDYLTGFRGTLSIFNTQLPSNGIRQEPVRCSTYECQLGSESETVVSICVVCV